MRFSHILLLFLLLTWVSACATKSRQEQITHQQLLTDIKENDSKLFIFIVNFLEGKPRNEFHQTMQNNSQRQTGSRTASSSRSKQVDLQERLEKRVFDALDYKLEQTGFCRDGYFVLSNYIEFGTAEVRGECKESATDADRKLFAKESNNV